MDKLKISFLSRPGLSVQMVTMEITTQSQTVSKKSATSPPHKCAYIINYYYLHMKQFLRGSGYRRRSWALTRYVPACLLNSNSELTTNPLTFCFFAVESINIFHRSPLWTDCAGITRGSRIPVLTSIITRSRSEDQAIFFSLILNIIQSEAPITGIMTCTWLWTAAAKRAATCRFSEEIKSKECA